MRVLVGSRWGDGFLDMHRAPGDCRLEVLAWLRLTPVSDLYFERSPSIARLVQYVREIGLRAAARKVRSRRDERVRNEKYLACGFGRVLEPSKAGGPERGAVCAFIAPAVPACVERLAVDTRLTFPVDPAVVPLSQSGVLYLTTEAVPDGLDAIAGWSSWSGCDLAALGLPDLGTRVTRSLAEADWRRAQVLPVSAPSAIRLSSLDSRRAVNPNKPKVALVGYGNYAKTTILPAIAPYLSVAGVYELDPTQVPREGSRRGSWRWSTDSEPDTSELAAVFAAGFHHTHVPVALRALAGGSAAVVEKPLATRADQLDSLLEALAARDARYFGCFQRRYTRLNDHLVRDLDACSGEPLDYHCIVYEEPLPARHWYRWPTSGSRLLSNGCHWTDHFLYLNAWSSPVDWDVSRLTEQVIEARVVLQNGATFTMALTDRGSARIGMRDYVEVRAGDRTASIVDSSRYRAEGPRRVLRRAHVNKIDAYARMYTEIARRIAAGEPGDDPQTVRLSGGLSIELDSRLARVEDKRLARG